MQTWPVNVKAVVMIGLTIFKQKVLSSTMEYRYGTRNI